MIINDNNYTAYIIIMHIVYYNNAYNTASATVINKAVIIQPLAPAFQVIYPIQRKVGTRNNGTTSCGLFIIFVKNIDTRIGRANATNNIFASSFILFLSQLNNFRNPKINSGRITNNNLNNDQ
ncbi:MAG: hypothetical protein ACPK85_01180 [Methanosarcina sp.]